MAIGSDGQEVGTEGWQSRRRKREQGDREGGDDKTWLCDL